MGVLGIPGGPESGIVLLLIMLFIGYVGIRFLVWVKHIIETAVE